jgi:purine-binding chemotaxis protein CheW
MTTQLEQRQFCSFFVDGLYFGVPVEQVQEVIRQQPMTRVPLASDVLGGLINLRGQIVTAVDLRRRLGLPARPAEQPPMNVVIRADDGAVSLLVDQIGDVVDADAEAWEDCPNTVQGNARELIAGAYKVADRLLLVLDTGRAIDPTSPDARAPGA